MSYFVVVENRGNRYGQVKFTKNPDYIREYLTSNSNALITVNDHTLYQQSPSNTVTIFGPNTPNLYKYEMELYD